MSRHREPRDHAQLTTLAGCAPRHARTRRRRGLGLTARGTRDRAAAHRRPDATRPPPSQSVSRRGRQWAVAYHETAGPCRCPDTADQVPVGGTSVTEIPRRNSGPARGRCCPGPRRAGRPRCSPPPAPARSAAGSSHSVTSLLDAHVPDLRPLVRARPPARSRTASTARAAPRVPLFRVRVPGKASPGMARSRPPATGPAHPASEKSRCSERGPTTPLPPLQSARPSPLQLHQSRRITGPTASLPSRSAARSATITTSALAHHLQSRRASSSRRPQQGDRQSRHAGCRFKLRTRRVACGREWARHHWPAR